MLVKRLDAVLKFQDELVGFQFFSGKLLGHENLIAGNSDYNTLNRIASFRRRALRTIAMPRMATVIRSGAGLLSGEAANGRSLIVEYFKNRVEFGDLQQILYAFAQPQQL